MLWSDTGNVVPKQDWHDCSQVRVKAWLFPSESEGTIVPKWEWHKFENVSISFEKHIIISIPSFFSVMCRNYQVITFKALNVVSMSKFDLFCLIHKTDFCLANVNLWVSKYFATYPVNLYPVINTYDNIEMFGALFSLWFSVKQCFNDCNHMLG